MVLMFRILGSALAITLLQLTFTERARAIQISTDVSRVTRQNDGSEKRIEKSLREYFRKASGLGFSGAVLLAKDGKVVFRNGYGWADIKRRIPITSKSIF